MLALALTRRHCQSQNNQGADTTKRVAQRKDDQKWHCGFSQYVSHAFRRGVQTGTRTSIRMSHYQPSTWPTSIYRNMVLADPLRAVFPSIARKDRTPSKECTALPKANTPAAFVL
jgi:hypothetical protein